MRRTFLWIGSLALLAGCSHGDKSAASGSSAGNSEVAAAGGAAAVSPAGNKTKIDCSAYKGETAPQGQPADDILGIRQGMTLDQVRNVLLCKNPNYAINTSKQSDQLPSGGQMTEVDLTANTGLDRVDVEFLGPTDKQQVVRVDRTDQFNDSNRLPVQSIEQSISKKYGQFDNQNGQETGYIVRALDGERLSSDNSSYGECENGNIVTSSQMPCLESVYYGIENSSQNPQLATQFEVAINDYAQAWSMVQAAQQQLTQQVDAANKKASNGALKM